MTSLCQSSQAARSPTSQRNFGDSRTASLLQRSQPISYGSSAVTSLENSEITIFESNVTRLQNKEATFSENSNVTIVKNNEGSSSGGSQENKTNLPHPDTIPGLLERNRLVGLTESWADLNVSSEEWNKAIRLTPYYRSKQNATLQVPQVEGEKESAVLYSSKNPSRKEMNLSPDLSKISDQARSFKQDQDRKILQRANDVLQKRLDQNLIPTDVKTRTELKTSRPSSSKEQVTVYFLTTHVDLEVAETKYTEKVLAIPFDNLMITDDILLAQKEKMYDLECQFQLAKDESLLVQNRIIVDLGSIYKKVSNSLANKLLYQRRLVSPLLKIEQKIIFNLQNKNPDIEVERSSVKIILSKASTDPKYLDKQLLCKDLQLEVKNWKDNQASTPNGLLSVTELKKLELFSPKSLEKILNNEARKPAPVFSKQKGIAKKSEKETLFSNNLKKTTETVKGLGSVLTTIIDPTPLTGLRVASSLLSLSESALDLRSDDLPRGLSENTKGDIFSFLSNPKNQKQKYEIWDAFDMLITRNYIGIGKTMQDILNLEKNASFDCFSSLSYNVKEAVNNPTITGTCPKNILDKDWTTEAYDSWEEHNLK